MKRLIPAGLLAVFLAALCITASAVTGRLCRKTEQMVAKCEEALKAGNVEASVKAAEELANGWEDDSRILSFFSDSGPIDDIALLSASLQNFSLFSDSAALAECAEIRKLLEHIEEEQIFRIECLY